MTTVPYDTPVFSEPLWSNPSDFLDASIGSVKNIKPSGIINTGSRTYINFWNKEYVLAHIDGTRSYDSDGIIVKYEWYLNDVLVPSQTGAIATISLQNDFKNKIYLFATDDRGARDKSNIVYYSVRSPQPWEIDYFNINNI